MVELNQNEAFSKDKLQFFRNIPAQGTSNLAIIDNRVANTDYHFLLQNQQAIETEFNQMFAMLQKKESENKQAFWLYCYYCASLLESYYKAYEQSAKEAEFAKLKLEIKDRLDKKPKNAEAQSEFINAMQQKFVNSINNLSSTPFHIAQIRDHVAFANLCRLYWVFCRLTLVQGLKVANDLKIIEQLDLLLGTQTDVNKIISVIQAPNGFLNYFSVGFFLTRFMIDGGLLLKHTFFPSELEADTSTRMERFKNELYKRHCNFANDAVWAIVNFLTNFNNISQIPGPVTGYITSTFLIFDVCLILHRKNLAKHEYLAKKAQYVLEREQFQDLDDFQNLTQEQRLAHIDMLDKQLAELEISWKAKEANFDFNAIAAALLMLGFGSSIVVPTAVMVFASYFVCQIAVAMYMSAGAFTQFYEKSLHLENAQLMNEDTKAALIQYEAAKSEFIFTMVKNATLPSVMIATFAICWPAAVILSAAYLGYEVLHAYNQHSDGNAAKQCARTAYDAEDFPAEDTMMALN